MSTDRNYISESIDNMCCSIERCLLSPNVLDSNLEQANIVDVIDKAASNLNKIANAITPVNFGAYESLTGCRVQSVTEALIFVGENLGRIADAIENNHE